MARRVRAYSPAVAVAAARVTVNSNKVLGIRSSDKLVKLASGDTSVLTIPADTIVEGTDQIQRATIATKK